MVKLGERWRMRTRKEIYLLTEGIIMGLGRNLVLGKFPGIHKNDTS